MATLGSLGLTYHLSAEEMAEAVRTALKSRTEGAAISPPSHTIAKANPLPISASTVKQQRSPQQIVDTFCDKRGWSLDKLADEAGVDRRQVFRVRHGKRVRRFALAAIAEVLGVEPENLISAVVPRLH
jgi:DNA-binding Xre family transcriptional regulator